MINDTYPSVVLMFQHDGRPIVSWLFFKGSHESVLLVFLHVRLSHIESSGFLPLPQQGGFLSHIKFIK